MSSAYTLTFTDQQVDKILTYIESMAEMCDTSKEQEFYQTWYDEVNTQLKSQVK